MLLQLICKYQLYVLIWFLLQLLIIEGSIRYIKNFSRKNLGLTNLDVIGTKKLPNNPMQPFVIFLLYILKKPNIWCTTKNISKTNSTISNVRQQKPATLARANKCAHKKQSVPFHVFTNWAVKAALRLFSHFDTQVVFTNVKPRFAKSWKPVSGKLRRFCSSHRTFHLALARDPSKLTEGKEQCGNSLGCSWPIEDATADASMQLWLPIYQRVLTGAI